MLVLAVGTAKPTFRVAEIVPPGNKLTVNSLGFGVIETTIQLGGT